MGNYITRNGINISLGIPAQITSFEEPAEDAHTTTATLRVFSVGTTGDLREFTREFAENLVKSLPGCPVVAYYDDEEQDFKGHNATQYVYGYVPEDSTPKFVADESGKLWSEVDVRLFTKRDDNIGNVARQVIGKAQSLELDPSTVDYQIEYKEGQVSRIKFLNGAFYGLSVLGDNQQPAFEGAGFFTKDVLDEFKALQKKEKEIQDFGGDKMDKNKFMSLGINEKIQHFETVISNYFGEDTYCYVCDFNEEQVIAKVYASNNVKFYAFDYSWKENSEYLMSEPYEVVPSYIRVEKAAEATAFEDCSAPEETPQVSEVENLTEEVEEKTSDSEEPTVNSIEESTEELAKEEEEVQEEVQVENAGELNIADPEGTDPKPVSSEEGESIEVNGQNNENDSSEEEEKEEDMGRATQDSSTDFAALSSEERDELNQLRKEKKINLIQSFKEFLTEEELNDFINRVNDFELNELETELKVKSFDSNKERINKSKTQDFGMFLPNVNDNNEEHSSNFTALDTTVARYLKR